MTMHRTAASAALGVALMGVGASAADATTAHPTATPATSASAPKVTCSALGQAGRVHVVRGQSTVSRQAARAIFAATVRCDKAGLVRRATHDGTSLEIGATTVPKRDLAVPDGDARYRALAQAFTTTPGYEKASRSYVWPRVATESGTKDPAAWREAVRAGLITQKESRQMQRDGSGYLGWRTSVGADGTWQYFVAGD